MIQEVVGFITEGLLWLVRSVGALLKMAVDTIATLPNEVLAILVIFMGLGFVCFMFYQQAEHSFTSRITMYLIMFAMIGLIVIVLSHFAGFDILNVFGI